MKKVYIVMYRLDYWNQHNTTIVFGVFNSRKKAIELIMETFKGLVFTYDSRIDKYIREEPEQELTRTMWIEEWPVG